MQKQRIISDKRHQLSEKTTKESNQWVAVIEGEIIFRIFNGGEQIWSNTLRRGDLLYIPKGATY